MTTSSTDAIRRLLASTAEFESVHSIVGQAFIDKFRLLRLELLNHLHAQIGWNPGENQIDLFVTIHTTGGYTFEHYVDQIAPEDWKAIRAGGIVHFLDLRSVVNGSTSREIMVDGSDWRELGGEEHDDVLLTLLALHRAGVQLEDLCEQAVNLMRNETEG